jgi:glycosyltransferase involved in cell wall biosynthesis
MHICYICDEYPPFPGGGIGTFTQTLARNMVSRKHKVSVVGSYKINELAKENDMGVDVYRMPCSKIKKIGFMFNWRALNRLLVSIHNISPIDIIEGPELSLAGLRSSLDIKKIIRMNGGHHFFSYEQGEKSKPWRSYLERKSFKKADFVCGVSKYVVERTRELLCLGSIPIEVINNPVDTNIFQPNNDIKEIDGLIVFCGTVCEKKGIRQLIDGMPEIITSVPNAQLRIVGRDLKDSITGESFMETLIRRIPEKIKSSIMFLGPILHEKIPNILSQAQICIYPSHMEAMPLAWIEGLAMGKPVIGSMTGPGPEVIENNISGLLCDPYNPHSIAENVIRLLLDRTLRVQLSEKARKRAVSMFSIDLLVSKNINYYTSCIRMPSKNKN